jgi:hypothetical protein
MSTLSAGLAISSAHLILGQQSTGQGRSTRQQDTGSDFQIPIEAQRDELFFFRASTFKPYVGDIFQVANARGEMITLHLVRANEFRTTNERIQKRKSLQPTGFTLTFRSSEQLSSLTSIHKMTHPALGSFDLFLTTREAVDGSFLYEAVFSQLP